MPLYDFKCPKCSQWGERLVRNSDERPSCDLCETPMEKLPSCPAPPVMAAGRSAQSRYEHGQKLKATLTKRSLDHDQSKQGRQQREEQVAKLRKNGTIPEGWNA